MGLWQKISGAFGHKDARHDEPARRAEADYEASRHPNYDDLEKDKDRKEALTTGVGYGVNNEDREAREQFNDELDGAGKPFGRDR